MERLLDFWPGMKTYVVLGAAALLWLGGATGVLSPETVENGLEVCVIVGGGTLAMKINRLRGAGSAASLALVGFLSASMLAIGCAAVPFDGARADAIAERQLARVVEVGSPVSSEDCDPLAAFEQAMLDRSGSESVYRPLWTDNQDTAPRRLAREAGHQLAGCRILQDRGVSGEDADRMRSILRDFWTRAGSRVGPDTE